MNSVTAAPRHVEIPASRYRRRYFLAIRNDLQ